MNVLRKEYCGLFQALRLCLWEKNPFILTPKTNRLFSRTLTRKTRAKLLKVTRNRTVNSEISGRLFKATH